MDKPTAEVRVGDRVKRGRSARTRALTVVEVYAQDDAYLRFLADDGVTYRMFGTAVPVQP